MLVVTLLVSLGCELYKKNFKNKITERKRKTDELSASAWIVKSNKVVLHKWVGLSNLRDWTSSTS